MTHDPPDRDATLAAIAERLAARFPDLPAATIRDAVTTAYDGFADAHVRDFVEVLVEKEAKKRLKKLNA